MTLAADAEAREVLRIAREAADLVLGVYRSSFTVEMKGPNDPVTRADREANDLICERLERAFPGDAVLAEESAPTDPALVAALADRPRVFYVDPLDGTREFVEKNGEFAVMIGLCVGGRAELGVLVLPATGEALAGRAGAAPWAELERPGGAVEPLAVSTVGDPREARLLVSRSRRPRLVEPIARELGVTRLEPCGSVGMKVARIARGEAELYVHGSGPRRWDLCGPEAVLVGAGGRFTALDGTPLVYRGGELTPQGGTIASNAALFDRVVAAAERAARS